MKNFEKYFTTYKITAGFFTALSGSLFCYFAWWGLSNALIETALALFFFFLLLGSQRSVWFWTGFFIALFWFWWIAVSFQHHGIAWAAPLGLLIIALIYGALFWLIAALSEKIAALVPRLSSVDIWLKALAVWSLSFIHPLGFDWFKPELVLVHSYLGVGKIQLAIILAAIALTYHRRNLLLLLLVVLAYSPHKTTVSLQPNDTAIALTTIMVTVKEKWDPRMLPQQIATVRRIISEAIKDEKKMLILPESVLPFFLNRERRLMDELLEQSKVITIVIGALYLDGRVHRNSTYIFHQGHYRIANKVVLVPFGESNPLPDWASDWVNKIFFDGAPDYIASANPTDFAINGITYRNAICYEATSEPLYDNAPGHMIVTSNNGWFVPSIEPTLQKLLLEYYSRKYGTTIYHSTNMSPAYTITRF